MVLFVSLSSMNFSSRCMLLMEFNLSGVSFVQIYYIVDISVPVYDFIACLFLSGFSMCMCSMLCMNISANILEMGEAIGSPSGCM